MNTGIDEFSITMLNTSMGNTTYSTMFNFTHDVMIDKFVSNENTVSCFLNSTLSTKAVKFECTDINYDNFYMVEFNGMINLSNDTFPIIFVITFGTEQELPIPTTG